MPLQLELCDLGHKLEELRLADERGQYELQLPDYVKICMLPSCWVVLLHQEILPESALDCHNFNRIRFDSGIHIART
jgi:hypothetical protein